MPVNKVKRRGSYAPLSAHYYKDDAVLLAGEKAELLYVRSLAFCADVLNDGDITTAQLALVGLGLTGVTARALKLVEVGLWERIEGGYRVRGWLEWNKSRDQILGDAREDAKRKTPKGNGDPLPPDPGPDEEPSDDPYDHQESCEIPNGNEPESDGTPNGFQSPARRPARPPSRAGQGRAGQGSSTTGRSGGEGSTPVGIAGEPPAPCGLHADDDRPCRRCRDVRLADERADADAIAAALSERDAARRAARDCPWADWHDPSGLIEDPETREPGPRCDHATHPRIQLARARGAAS